MKKFIRNLLLALPLLFAVNLATPTKADAEIIIVRYPHYEYQLRYVYGPYYAWVNYGGYLVYTVAYGWHYEYQLVLVY